MKASTERTIVEAFIGAAMILFGLSYLVRAFGPSDDEMFPDDAPTLFDCGCSRVKVAAGLCSIYGPDGRAREKSTGEVH